jgi:hypothetical protein
VHLKSVEAKERVKENILKTISVDIHVKTHQIADKASIDQCISILRRDSESMSEDRPNHKYVEAPGHSPPSALPY